MKGGNSLEPIPVWGISLVFLVLTVTFLMDVWGEKREVVRHPPTDPRHFTTAPVREAKIKPVYDYEGKRYGCNDCHATLEPSNIQKSFFSAHPDVILEHGANNYCQTCHNRGNMDRLLDINKNEVTFAKSHMTCLQCHGPIYRDWEQGLHGRMNDYWDQQRGEVRRLTCVACHDPHRPAFAPMEPAPAPTVRQYRNFLETLTVKDNDHDG